MAPSPAIVLTLLPRPPVLHVKGVTTMAKNVVFQKVVEMAMAMEELCFAVVHKSRKQAKPNAAPAPPLNVVCPKRVEIVDPTILGFNQSHIQSHVILLNPPKQAPRHAQHATTRALNGKFFIYL